MKSIRVLAVDDSALMCNMLSAVVNQQPDMENGRHGAGCVYCARVSIKQLNLTC